MKLLKRASIISLGAILISSSAGGQVSVGFDDGKKPKLLCRAWQGSGQLYGWEEVPNNPKATDRFDYHARKFFESTSGYVHVDCLSFANISAGFRSTFEPGSFVSSEGNNVTVLRAPFLSQGWETTPVPTESRATKKNAAGQSPAAPSAKPEPSNYVEVPGPDGVMRLSPEVIARNKAAAEDHQRKLAEYSDAVAKAKAVNERNAELHAQSVAKAAAEREEHERKMVAYAAEIEAQKVAANVVKSSALAPASTNDDPNRCITSPAIKPGLRGNTEVHVTNGCDQKVDIVICLKRTTGDWLCGARFGILSQRSMSFMSTNATGEIYVDAVTFGGKQKLGRPAGIIK